MIIQVIRFGNGNVKKKGKMSPSRNQRMRIGENTIYNEMGKGGENTGTHRDSQFYVPSKFYMGLRNMVRGE